MTTRSIRTATIATAFLLLVAATPAAAADSTAMPAGTDSCSSPRPTDGGCYEWPGDPSD
ncbi:MAG TPA: hypothetical protein VGF17_13495 [Phytomonospora sp.]